jgi:Helix-turn-helix domain
MQIELLFTENVSHQNNAQSQKQLEDSLGHFNKQCSIVLKHLLTGQKLSGMQAITYYKIIDIRPRIATLKKSGILISEQKIQGAHGAKEWFMSETEIVFNKIFLENFTLI